MLGYHVGKGKDYVSSLSAAKETLTSYGFRPSAQIFVMGPQSSRVLMQDKDIDAVSAWVRRENFPLCIHSAYTNYLWGESAAAIASVNKEMDIAAAISAQGVVVHLGAGAKDAHKLKSVLERLHTPSTLWLEMNTAKPSAGTFETTESIVNLFDDVASCGLNLDIGFCIDTAHAYACGMNFREYAPTAMWLADLPPAKYMVHLNDSARSLGSGKDRHAQLLHGEMWRGVNPEESGLKAVLDFAEGKNTLCILERGEGLHGDLALIQSMGYFQS